MASNLLMQARNESLLTQEEVSEKLGVSTATICQWEKNPEKITIGRLRNLYDVVNPTGKVLLKKFTDDIFLR